jgi:AraC-like DNA-binding protein
MSEYMHQFYQNLIAYAVQKDIPADWLADISGIDLRGLRAGHFLTVSVQQFNDLWQGAISLSEDPLFGLHFGEVMQLSALGLIGSVIRNSHTVGEAFQHCADFTEVLTDLFRTKVHNGQQSFTVEFIPVKDKLGAYPVLQKQLLEFSMAFVLHELDGLLFTKIRPLSVEMPLERAQGNELSRVLRCGQIRAGKRYRMEFDNVFLKEPVIAANFTLQQVLLERAKELRARGRESGQQELALRVSRLLEGNTYLGLPSLQEVAGNLHLSTRSLQRRLKQEGVSFGDLVESVQKTTAIHYLRSSGYPLKEISFMLGYNELSAFSRAFKKWTGRTPQDFRKAAAN